MKAAVVFVHVAPMLWEKMTAELSGLNRMVDEEETEMNVAFLTFSVFVVVGVCSTSPRGGGVLRRCLRLAVRSRLGLGGINPQVQMIVYVCEGKDTTQHPFYFKFLLNLSFVSSHLFSCFLSVFRFVVLFFVTTGGFK